ncbi:MAG: hypothetical protein IPL02_08305 [Moraxellaceae bacterium]|nr:hypothetical protein [Moraxellaceae bacterium]
MRAFIFNWPMHTQAGIKPIPDALRTCDKFSLLKGERGLIQGQNYTPSEINSLVERYEKPLFYHALDCSICHIEKARYCANGYAIGSVYDALLLVCEDAQARREDLALRIDRACISGRSVFEAFNPANVLQSPNSAFETHKWGNTPDYEAFINHWTACEVCKPNLGRYCSEGQKLKTGEYTADKVKERKRKAANKRPLYKGGAVFETYGDKRFKWDRSSKYRGAFGCARYAAIREKLKSLI